MTVFYAYDTRTQLEQPVFIVYDEKHLAPMLKTLYDEGYYDPEHVLVTTLRMHTYNNDGGFIGGSKVTPKKPKERSLNRYGRYR